MDSAPARFALQGIGLALILSIFCLERFLWRRSQRRGSKRRRFYPTSYALGNAFQQLQQFVAPNTEYTLEEDAEDDDEGGPDDPAKHLERQLKRIRRGERIEKLTTILSNEDK